MRSILLLLSLVPLCIAHSWIACADYPSSLSLDVYNENQCRAFARDFNHYWVDGFGVDRGYNYRLQMSDPICKTDFKVGSSYTERFRAPVYEPGRNVRLLWPAKNHVKADCTNQWIPDTQLKLIALQTQFGKNPSLTDALRDGVVVWDFHQHGTKKGFQQCINFCANPDKAICYGDWVVPREWSTGPVLLVWFWEFNKNEFYTSCMDVIIQATSSTVISTSRSPTPQLTKLTSISPSPFSLPSCRLSGYLKKCQRLLDSHKSKNSCQ